VTQQLAHCSMPRPFYKKFLEDDDAGDDADWDAAARLVNHDGSDPQHSRSLCPECSRPLRRIASIPACAACLMCGSSKICSVCEETILAGDMHFICTECEDITICSECGPGIYIERQYDFVDADAGQRSIKNLPSKAVHTRNMGFRAKEVSMEAFELAQGIVTRAASLAKELTTESEDIFDREWQGQLDRLLGTSDLNAMISMMHMLIGAAQALLASQATLNKVRTPCKVFGDLHGQFRDMLMFFAMFGMPGSSDCPSFVFNGDFVDRGKHQVEVISLLFALKIAYPQNVWLNRGNHEDENMNAKYGFQKACLEACGQDAGQKVFNAFASAFTYIPIASLIDDRILVLHGGIGDGKWSVADVDSVQRPLTHDALTYPENTWIWNILWSDPIEEDKHGLTFGVHSSPRSKVAVRFGWNVTQAFCAKNGLDLIIRSHQAKKGGFGFDVMHSNKLLRIFSARDYESNGNDGAVLDIRACKDSDDQRLLARFQVLSSLSKGGDEDCDKDS